MAASAPVSRVSGYRLVTWNSGGLNRRRDAGNRRGDFLLRMWGEDTSLGVMAIQETHCRNDGELCQGVIDMKARLNVFHSPAVDGDVRAGVLLVLTHDWEVVESVVGVPGRVLSVRVKSGVFGDCVNFVVVYGKSGGADGGAWLDGLAAVLDDTYATVVLGDFNFVGELRDRKGAAVLNGYDRTLAAKFAERTGDWELHDVFREVRGNDDDFTFRHDAGWESRIDRVYMGEELVGKVTNVTSKSVLGEQVGHRMVEVEIEEGLELGRGYWKFNVSLLRDSAYRELIRVTWAEVKEDRGEFENVGEWWDYAKGLLRTVTIEFARKKRWEETKVVRELEREKSRLMEEIGAGYGSVFAGDHLREIETRLGQEEERRAEGYRVRSRVPHFEDKEPGVAYFSRQEKRGSKRNLIYALKDTEGRVRRGTEQVVKITHDFYTGLFTRGDTDEGTQDRFLSQVDVGLTRQQQEWCDGVIDKGEVECVLKKMAAGKSPGADGFPVEFWRHFWDVVGGDFMDVVEWVAVNGRVTESMSGGVIRLLFKKGDRGDVRNYRPITLVNADYKLVSGCVAARLSSVLPGLIHEDQTGLPGRRISDGIHVVSDTIEYCQKKGVSAALVSLDQEKCFDRVDHGFLFRALATYGFGPGFLGLVRAFYNGATSRVLVNGVFSDQVRLDRGLRQGDPPSSLLYILTAEVLANAVRKDSQIKGIRIKGREKKIGGYADDTQGFLTTDDSVGRFLGLANEFGRASGSRLNRDKTEGIWLGPWQERTGNHHGLNWKERIKVLGVWLGRGNVAGANFGDAYGMVRSRFYAWKGRPLSALGKAKVANVFLFSSLWYRTEVVDPVKDGRGLVPGYGDLEKEVGGWLFWGRQEVGAARLRDSYDKGGAQLVDITDKVRTQRVLWLKRLLSMSEGSFPRILADELIGDQWYGYAGLSCLKGLEAGLKVKVSGFYKGAIAAWSKLGLTYRHGNCPVESYHLFFNRMVTDRDGHMLTTRRNRGVLFKGHTVSELREVCQRMGARFPVLVPDDKEGADEPDFVLRMAGGGEIGLSATSFKEVYAQFRSLRPGNCHFEAKWENALGLSLGGQWSEIWGSLHNSGASLRVRSAVWRQIGLNFWTCYTDHAYIGRGDGMCEMCGVFARQRWHTVIECQVVKDLWDRLSVTLVRLDNRGVTAQEMALGLIGQGDRIRLRNRLGYTLRSAVLAMRWIGVRDVGRAVGNIWGSFLVQLKRELVEGYWVGRLGGGLGPFTREVLVDGVLGSMGGDGVVEWGPLLDGVWVGYWQLYH